MTQLAPDSEPERRRSSESRIKPPPPPILRAAAFWASLAAVCIARGMAFGGNLDTVPKLLSFMATLSLGFGGILLVFGDTATLTVGKFFKARGVIAVGVFDPKLESEPLWS